MTNASVKQALDRGAELFKWEERKARAGTRQGSKVRGVGVAVGPHGAGSIGYDGLMTIQPDGRLYVQSGIGNLGTHSVIDVARVAADLLAMPWEKVEVNWGSTAKHIPWTCMSVGSQTTHAMTRANLAGAENARLKLQEIAAKDLGGAPGDYELGGERVYRKGDPSRGISYARAAARAIELGGTYDGHELPDEIHPFTKASATALAGLGLMGVGKDVYPRDGDTYSFVIGFAEVEVDSRQGGHWSIISASAWASSSIRAAWAGRSLAAAASASDAALMQKWVFDPAPTAWRSRSSSTTPSRSPFWIFRTRCSGRRWLPIPRRPSARGGIGEPPRQASWISAR